MRNRLTLSVCCLAVLLSLTACSKIRREHLEPKATLTLALRAGVYADVIKKSLPEFELKNNVICKVQEFSEDELHSILAGESSKKASYDFCMVDGSWMAEFTSRGILAELSGLGYSLDDDIIPATTAICYQNGGLYLAPFYGNVTVLLYNKLMIQEAGYTPGTIESMEDLLQICQFQKKRHNWGFIYRGDTENNVVVDFLPVLRSFGAWVVDSRNNPTVNTPEFKKALEFYMRLIETGRACEKDDLVAAIANKSATMAIGWPGWYTPTRNSAMDYLALTGKENEDGVSHNVNIYGIWAVGIPSGSKNKEHAVRLLDYLMNPAVQKASVSKGGVPCRYSILLDKDVLKSYPQYEVVCKALEGGVYRPVMDEWSAFYTILGAEMKLIIEGKESVDEGLSIAQKQLERMLAGRRRR